MFSKRRASQIGPVYVFIRCFNRPLYLWACLDSLYRYTTYPCRFILIDNSSTDPLIRQVVEGFQKRGFFHAVHFMDHNHPANQNMVYVRYRSEMGRYLVLLDADITVEKQKPCWLTRMIDITEKRPHLAILGSYVDRKDFIDPQWAQKVEPQMPEQQLNDLIKTSSPERDIPVTGKEVISPFNPPGRLLLLRTAMIDRIGLNVPIAPVCQAARKAGYKTGIATRVKHRHLSLLNFFDYADYDFDQLRHYWRGQ